MIVVNNQNSEQAYWPLRHAEWNGWTPTDLIFPFFLFIVGVSLVFSFQARLQRGDSRRKLVLHTIRRSVRAVPDRAGAERHGVAATIHLAHSRSTAEDRHRLLHRVGHHPVLRNSRPRDLDCRRSRLATGRSCALYRCPATACPTVDVPLLHPDFNLAAYLDRKLMLGHMWEKTRDPEGVLSTIPAIATALCGVLTGEWLQTEAHAKRRKLWACSRVGIASVIAGEIWSRWFPINKNLWTSSYVLFTAGGALICLALCCWVTDIKLHRGPWTKPFVILGTNAITAYVLSQLIGGWFGWDHLFAFQRLAANSPALASLLHSLLILLLLLPAGLVDVPQEDLPQGLTALEHPNPRPPAVRKCEFDAASTAVLILRDTMSVPAPSDGQVFGHYRLIEQIGAGGMGVVFRAHDEQLRRDVAVKILPHDLFSDAASRERFRKEALAVGRLNHPNIAMAFDFGEQDGVDYLVTEYIPGINLDEKIGKQALPQKTVLELGIQILSGLEAAHRENVIHRDLKPGNIRLNRDGQVKILDFGLAKLAEPFDENADTVNLTSSVSVSGTLPYMAPELLRAEDADARADIWAAGAVLYEMATGRRAFPDKQPSLVIDAILHYDPVRPTLINPKITASLEAVILKALDRDPDRRYQSAREFRVDLQRLLAGGEIATDTLRQSQVVEVSATAAATEVRAGFLACLLARASDRLLRKAMASAISRPSEDSGGAAHRDGGTGCCNQRAGARTDGDSDRQAGAGQ